ncbi:tetratricopeptide repeat protein [Parvicella tangerina]|uniref:SH3b domain-containing protein n=1 Tax=Parvicella tangerina TaxID=2829795 RepID=A0A916JPN6_9FLAO|nr:tetratricopeptide repeat protein [Parvicella tangerina]CAG5084918.1 hypothetical protein CRYO30217_02600 [Parvicella tangerina]
MLVKLSLIISLLLSVATGFSQQSPEKLFELANTAYDNQQYDSSLTLYKAIEEKGLVSPELYQNMGNAAYKLNLVPDAIYYFEKGLKLNPGNDDLEHNLKLAQEKQTDKGGATFDAGLSSWLSKALGGTSDFWSILAVLFAAIGAVLLLAYSFINRQVIRKVGIIGGPISWGLTVVFVGIAYLQYNVANNTEYGILFEPSIEVRNDPSEAASIAFVLHEGSKLKILDENEKWYKVSFDAKKVGWLPKESLKVI